VAILTRGTHWTIVSIQIDEVTEYDAVGRSYMDAPEVVGKVYSSNDIYIKHSAMKSNVSPIDKAFDELVCFSEIYVPWKMTSVFLGN
jgi:hypothetical protein